MLRKREEMARKEADTSSREKGLQLQVSESSPIQRPSFGLCGAGGLFLLESRRVGNRR